eukprot:Hpha_TRINITY_DN16375_c1_g5::TRINITY_DN16375_c1_g5_i1::g.62932::m.62932
MMLGCTPVNMQKQGLPAWNFLQCDGNLLTRRRAHHTAVQWDNKMIVWGGAGAGVGNEVCVYDFRQQTWTQQQCGGDAPPQLAGHTAVIWDDTMWVFGGYEITTRATSDGLWALVLRTGIWHRVAPAAGPVPCCRGGHAATVLERAGCMLMHGGESVDAQMRSTFLADLWIFAFAQRQWLPVRQVMESDEERWRLPRARKHHTLVHSQEHNTAYLFGGCDYRMAINDFHILSTENLALGPEPVLRWTQHEGGGFPPTERWGHAAAAYNGRMHLFGGRETPADPVKNPITDPCGVTGLGFILNDWYKFSFKNKIWIRLLPNGHVPLPRWGHTVCQHEGVLYVFGGVGQRGPLNDMYSITLQSLSTVMHDMSTTHMVSRGPPLTAEQLLQHLAGRTVIDDSGLDLLCKRQGGVRGSDAASHHAERMAADDDGEMVDASGDVLGRRLVRAAR